MVNNTIAKANGRDKLVDFQDCLELANVEDYAMMHGAGGHSYARSSVIKVVICDYSAGAGKSVTRSANISIATCAKLLEVCKKNIGDTVVDNNIFPLTEARNAQQYLVQVGSTQTLVTNGVTETLRGYSAAEKKDGKEPPFSTLVRSLGVKMAKAIGAPPVQNNAPPAAFLVPNHCDVTISQDRVHSYKTGADGFAPVQRLYISHQTYRPDGSVSRYPWIIKITAGEAKVNKQESGAVTFTSSTMRNTVDLSINLSDDDMFRCMDAIMRYVDAWEKAYCLTLIQTGKEKRRQEYLASQNNGQAAPPPAPAQYDGAEGYYDDCPPDIY